MRTIKHWQGLFVAAAVVAAGTACSTGADSSSSTGTTVRYAIRSDPGELDPSQSTNSAGQQVAGLAYDALVALTGDGKIVSNLAKSWTFDASSATFTLNKGVKCDDGHELTASDIAKNFEWIKTPANHSPLLGSVLPGSGYTTTADDAAGTFAIKYAEPSGFILEQLSKVLIVCPSSIGNRSKLATGSDGTGPFTVTAAVPGKSYDFAVRDGYTWGPDGAGTGDAKFPHKVTVVVSTNETTAANQLLSGELNIADIRGPDTPRLKDRKLFERGYFHITSELFFNQAQGRLLADEALRKALVQGAALDQVAKVNTGNLGSVATRLTDGGGEPCADDVTTGVVPAYDVTAANAALDRLGWTTGADGKRAKDGRPLELTLIYPSNAQSSVSAGQLLASLWEKNLHIAVRTQPLTPAAIDGKWSQAGNWGDVALARASDQLPSNLVGQFSGATPPNGTNFSAVANAKYRDLAGRAYGQPGQQSCALWNEAAKALLSAANVLPVAAQNSIIFGNGVSFEVGAGAVIPTSLRLG
ncbi:ABC transporter substrate-binding protein [Kribbella sp. CWNU-51]